MIVDLFDGAVCEKCGSGYKLGDGPPPFERTGPMQRGHELSWVCRCKLCKNFFTIIFIGEAE